MKLGSKKQLVWFGVMGLLLCATAYTILRQQSPQELAALIEEELQNLAEEVARQVLQLNGKAPSALFLAGGGSKLFSLREHVAQALNMDQKRVTVAGRYFQNSAWSDICSACAALLDSLLQEK